MSYIWEGQEYCGKRIDKRSECTLLNGHSGECEDECPYLRKLPTRGNRGKRCRY